MARPLLDPPPPTVGNGVGSKKPAIAVRQYDSAAVVSCASSHPTNCAYAGATGRSTARSPVGLDGAAGEPPAALPSSLGEAIEAFAGSALMRETLGEHVFETLITNKREEWARYRVHVSDYERTRYLPLL